jgi:hypothetical protein
MGFYKDAFCDRNMIWDTYRPYLHDRPPQPWTLFGLNEAHARNQTRRASSLRVGRTRRLAPHAPQLN